MKNMPKASWILLILMLSFSSTFSQDQCKAVGWATQNGGTTGGGSATPVTVSTLADLQMQAKASGAKVIYVSGTMGAGVSTRVSVAANKTIIGLPGAKLFGGFDVKANNIIIRNMIVQGPGAVDVDGVDCITIEGASNIWIDHCELYDGQDGNMDITNEANYVSVTWCKFYYTSASKNHQFCDLIGSSDSKTSDRGKLKITFMYNWWAQGCKERMPRVRFGQVHVVNNYFGCTGNNHCVRAGLEADLLVESNYFDNVKLPIDLYENNFTAVTSRNNTFVNTSGNTAGSGTAFTPPYTLSIAPSANVKSLVTAACGAGATMSSPTACACGTTTPPPSKFTLTTTVTPSGAGSVANSPTGSSFDSATMVTLTATVNSGYQFIGWSGGASGTSTSTTVTMNSNKAVTANFRAIPKYNVTTTVAPSGGGTVAVTPSATTYDSGTVITVKATPASGYSFTNWNGDASGTVTSVSVTVNSNKNITANFQVVQVTAYTLTTSSNPAVGGTISKNPNAASYNSGTSVALTVTPASGYMFTGWSGDASGTSTSVNVIMTANKTVTANFRAIPKYTITTSVLPAGGGTVSLSPSAATYDSGTVVTATAIPASGYSFVNWSGDASGTAAATTITANGNKNITANFQVVQSGGSSTIRIEQSATPSTGLCSYDGIISSNSGANDSKVINLTNSSGKGITWRVNVPSNGTYTLVWRYTNSGSGNATTAKFLVNGATINSAISFPKTNGSTTFSTVTATVSFSAGINVIRLETTVSSAFADIDWLEITGDSPTPGNCLASRPTIDESNAAVFPNPAKDNVTIHYNMISSNKVSIKIFDSFGRLVEDLGSKSVTAGDQQLQYNVAGKAPGVYNIVLTGSAETKILKLVVN
ncbi:InlB B-repeat-containing protein [Ferruginibacter albus]|uniref:InlB B-repeat-containing protein n=1 Tax=Ferruginibacter albus TaxID=2875540 RepID=UPI001CC5FC85|nr:T9SS type A sorting domain-containing protein [Ferruginibacter albus]UAY51507.1 InlB B-repeat-containing protein [Ferruginibacter albus]